MRRNVVALMAVVVAAALVSAADTALAADATPSQIIQILNAQRSANGLPSVTENPSWSQACRAHDVWMEHNDQISHVETPGTPFYTTAGAWAGTSAVLAGSESWHAGDPWQNAPIHLAQVMNPSLATAGAYDLNGYSCLTTWPGESQSMSAPADTLDSFPGNGGSVAYSQTAFEAPHTPGEWLGLSSNATTGPYLLVYWVGPSTGAPLSLLSAATVSGPGGAAQVAVINDETSSPALGNLGGYIGPSAGMILPLHPLAPNSTYTATATFSTDPATDQGAPSRTWTGTFTFHTTAKAMTGDPAPYSGPGYLLSRIDAPRRISYQKARHGIAVAVHLPIAAHVQLLLRDRHGLIAVANGAKGGPGSLRLVVKPDPITLVNAFGRTGNTAKLHLTVEAYDNSSNAAVTRTIVMKGL